jgi:AcrR family transcriptional regulator
MDVQDNSFVTLWAITGVKGQVQRRGVERRRELVHAAMELFARHGYRGTSLAAVAARAGGPASLVTHHFGSKEKLLKAVLEELDQQALARLDDILHRPGLAAALERFRRNAENMTEIPHLVALHTTLLAENLAAGAPLHAYFLDRNRLLRRLMEEVLREAAGTGEIAADVRPEIVAAEVTAFLEGAAVQWLLDPEGVDLVELYRSYFGGLASRLAAGLGAEGGFGSESR